MPMGGAIASPLATLLSAIVLHKIGVDFILLEPVVSEIFYFKHDVGASLIIIFICNPDVHNIGNTIIVLT